ncbi:MAG: DUF4274 domain-containing protein [Microscillaceae bacterium]|jgi:hypothetical protein|nr:DUF4274 domain-containing protein [Microscillaceae bacterium]
MNQIVSQEIEKLFKKVCQYNWDNGFQWLYEVVQNDYCDRGTTLMIYWLSRPEWFCQYALAKDVKPWDEDNYQFVRFVEKIYPSIKLNHIIYDPLEDGQIGLYTEDFVVKAPLPALMYQKTEGVIYFKDIS